MTERWGRERQRRDLLSAVLVPRFLPQIGLGWAEARSLKSCAGLPRGWQSRCPRHHLLPPGGIGVQLDSSNSDVTLCTVAPASLGSFSEQKFLIPMWLNVFVFWEVFPCPWAHCPSTVLLFWKKKKILFIYSVILFKDREKQRSSMCLFTPHLPMKARTEPDSNQKSRTPFGSHAWMAAIQVLKLSSTTSQEACEQEAGSAVEQQEHEQITPV